MALEEEVVNELKDFVKSIVDDKEKSYMFENHIDEKIKAKLEKMDINKTSQEIASKSLKNVKELEKAGVL